MKKVAISIVLVFGMSQNSEAQQNIFSDGFESGRFSNFWIPTPGADAGVVQVVLDFQGIPAARTGSFGVAMGKSAHTANFTRNTLDLLLDLSNHQQIELSFWIKDQQDEDHPEDGILFSDDGGNTFRAVYKFQPSKWNDGVYGQLPPIDIDRLASDNSLTLNDQFVIRFQQYGLRTFTGTSSIDGFFLDDVTVRPTVIIHAALPFEDGFETGSFGSAWRWADATYPSLTTNVGTVLPGGWVEVVQDAQGLPAAHSGTFGAILGRRVHGELTTNALDLHLDLSGQVEVELSFWIKDRHDDDHPQDGIFFSDDGGETFTPARVYQFEPSKWNDDIWGRFPPIDVAALARDRGMLLTDKFVIRFQQYGSRTFTGTSILDGLFLDDFEVKAVQRLYATLPFSDSFESGSLGDSWKWADATYPGSTTNPGTVLPGGLVEVVQNMGNISAPRSGSFAVAMGRRANGELTTNALDLHLNLMGHDQVKLDFWIKDVQDNDHPQDAIFFSNDGGLTFAPSAVYQFVPSQWRDNEYQHITLDVDSLARSRGLNLTDRFVIRFQQYGAAAFGGDGFFVDDVSVTSTATSVEGKDHTSSLPKEFALRQNHPNPFNPSTQISFALPKAQKVTLKVFDLTGKEVAVLLLNETKVAGVHELTFDAKHLPSGIYLYRLQADEFMEMKRMVLIR